MRPIEKFRSQPVIQLRRGLSLPIAVGLGLLPLLALLLAVTPGTATAGGVVTTCTEAGLDAALAGGGLVTFNCAAHPVTITVTAEKIITTLTTIDGGALGQVILSGGQNTRVFLVQPGASLTLLNLVVRDGAAPSNFEGGAVFVDHARLALTNTAFISNTSQCCGGAIYLSENSTATVASSTFAGNSVLPNGGGGAISNEAWLTITDSTFHDNDAEYGGALTSYGPLSLARVSFYGNYGREYAGAIYNEGPAALVDVAIYSNTVLGPNGWGGGMDSEYTGTVTLDRVQIYANHVISGHPYYAGGGLSVFYGPLNLAHSSVYSNVAGSGPGGGIHASYGATLTVLSSAIYGNRALNGAGGGIDVRTVGGVPALKLINVTLSGNTATAGGGLSSENGIFPIISYTTFYSNDAAVGKNITGVVILANTLIAGGGSANCAGLATSYGYNLDDGNSCHLGGLGDLTNTNPLLGPLVFNGGPSLTRALLPGSPAIDAASPLDCPPTDQRGAGRPANGDGVGGARCDIGAFEYLAIPPGLWLPLMWR